MFPIIRKISAQAVITAFFIFFILAWLGAFNFHIHWLWVAIAVTALVILAFADLQKRQHSMLRNCPISGHLRFLFEAVRPELRKYFRESYLDEKPFKRRQWSRSFNGTRKARKRWNSARNLMFARRP